MTLQSSSFEAIPIETYTVRVSSVVALNADVYQVFLKTDQVGSYYAGQYLELLIADQAYPFSIANAPGSAHLELHIRCLPGHRSALQVIEHLQQAWHQATTVALRLPLGVVSLASADQARALIFLAASTGFSQVKALLEAALVQESTQPLYLYWVNASAADFYWAQMPLAWQQQVPRFHYHPVVYPTSSDWSGRSGWLHDLVLEDFNTLEGCRVFACGSEAMVRGTLNGFLTAQQRGFQFLSDWVLQAVA